MRATNICATICLSPRPSWGPDAVDCHLCAPALDGSKFQRQRNVDLNVSPADVVAEMSHPWFAPRILPMPTEDRVDRSIITRGWGLACRKHA
jgi:hypothetical protein